MYDVRGMKSEEPRSGNNLQDLQDFAWFAVGNADSVTKQENTERNLQSSKCCKIPTTNREFWVAKIRRNQERDRENYDELYRNGWKVIVIWECQLTASKLEHTMREVAVLLEENMLSLYKRPTPFPYSTEEEEYLSIAAEERTPYGE